jgi:outer membrane protein assembly factor BamB
MIEKMNREQTIKFAANAAIIAVIFTAFVALLMLLNYYQLKSQDPLELKSLEILVEQLKDDPNNEELRNEIRNLDLLARKAFFTQQWQVIAGRYLLLFGGIVWIVAMRFYFSSRSKIEEPEGLQINEVVARTISQRWIIIAGVLLIILSFSASFAVTDHLKYYQGELADENRTLEEESTIEVIQITEKEDGLTTTDGSENESEPDTDDSEKEQSDITADQGAVTGTVTTGAASAVITAKTGSAFAQDVLKNHNGFRGPLGNGVSYHTDIPVEWDGATGKNIKWKTDLSRPGYNSPVIWENKLFVAGADAEGKTVYCLDINTGKIIWQKDITDIPGSPSQPPRVTDDTGLSAPSLTTDGIRIYALFGTGDIAALGMGGSILWARNLGVPDNHYGHSSSLLTWDNRLFIQYDSNKGGRILSLDTSTGEIQWDTRRNTGISWASPILAKIEDKYQLILSSAPNVAAYAPETGKELWSYECMMGEVGPSPAFGEGLVFAANEYARLVAIRPGAEPTVAWEDDEYLPEVASPVVSEGLLFIGTTYGVLACYDAATGAKQWEEEMNQGFYSSPMIADGKLYAMDMGGVMHIYSVSNEVHKLGDPALGEGSVTSPAFSPGRIYLRGDNFLYCIEKE